MGWVIQQELRIKGVPMFVPTPLGTNLYHIFLIVSPYNNKREGGMVGYVSSLPTIDGDEILNCLNYKSYCPITALGTTMVTPENQTSPGKAHTKR